MSKKTTKTQNAKRKSQNGQIKPRNGKINYAKKKKKKKTLKYQNKISDFSYPGQSCSPWQLSQVQCRTDLEFNASGMMYFSNLAVYILQTEP